LDATVEIAGKKIPYRVTTGKLLLKQDDGKSRASIFHVSYERTDAKDPANRPVMFAFNGGPGSSAVWLHIGVLGPKIIQLPGDGTTAPPPPARVTDNPQSILDVCDLVFVDPVSTGYSRTENEVKPGDFHGLDEDVESVGDFIRRWVSEHDRWASTKYLLGESYGGIRAAGLSQHLQSRYGMSLNGVVLLSSLLDFATLQDAPGNDLSNLVFLPSFTGVAHFHGKIQGDRDALIRESTAFAYGKYASALIKGSDLDDDEKKGIAAELARFSGIPAAKWLERDLRMNASIFRAELLRAEGKVLGRFDGRVAWDAADKAATTPDYDPSYSLAFGAFSTAMLDYLGRGLGYKEERPYEILTSKVNPWRWNANNSVVNVGNRLATAMRDNPNLRVLVMGGYTDLATPPEGVAYSLRHLPEIPESRRKNISTAFYDGGHMFYLNPPDLLKTRADLLDFIHPPAPCPPCPRRNF
jgi:carboxypeptidase C (cathepsin A)